MITAFVRRLEVSGLWSDPLLLTAPQVSWIRKRDLHILTTDIFTYTSDARFQVAHQEGSSNWTLLVNYAQVRQLLKTRLPCNYLPTTAITSASFTDHLRSFLLTER